MYEKSNDPLKNPINSPSTPNNKMNAILSSDGSIKIIFSSEAPIVDLNIKGKFLSKEIPCVEIDSSSSNCDSSKVTTISKSSAGSNQIECVENDQFQKYKQIPRQVFMATICQVCKVNLSRYFLCNGCKMVAYCKEDHLKVDVLEHRALCLAIQLIAKRRGGHIYNMSNHLSMSEFRNLKLHTIFICEQFLNRSLQTFEREILLFPRICHVGTCREWRHSLLVDCKKCEQVSFCANHPLTNEHEKFCLFYALFQNIVLRQKSYGRIEINLPHRVLKRIPTLFHNIDDTLSILYKNKTAFQDNCINASLTQTCTTPLTAFYAQQVVGIKLKEQMVIHLVGAEMQFEGDILNKWEAFYLHLAPEVSDLLIVFIGPELNTDNLPIEIISRIRMCRNCRQLCRGVRFDFQCKKFYHDYCDSSGDYVKPNLVCFFNPAFYLPGFRGFDTWPKSVRSAISTSAPVLVTSCTESGSFMDLEKIETLMENNVEVLQMPKLNPYSSKHPERNLMDDDVPLFFRNQYFFVVRQIPDFIDFEL